MAVKTSIRLADGLRKADDKFAVGTRLPKPVMQLTCHSLFISMAFLNKGLRHFALNALLTDILASETIKAAKVPQPTAAERKAPSAGGLPAQTEFNLG